MNMNECRWISSHRLDEKYKKKRANFGVWQLPLFNHLKPEYTNCESFLVIRGWRGLNTKVSENFPIENNYKVGVLRIWNGKSTSIGSSVGDWIEIFYGEIYQSQRRNRICMLHVMYASLLWCMNAYMVI